MNIAFESAAERLALYSVMSNYDESSHLKEREEQYAMASIKTPGTILIFKETEEGWWRESLDFKSHSQADKLMAQYRDDPTVTDAFIISARFNNPGGWHQD